MKQFQLIFLLSILVSCRDKGQEAMPPMSENGIKLGMPLDTGFWNDRLPAIRGVNPQGDSFDIRKISSKFILVEFWASWCPPCRRANPGLVEVYKKYKEKGFEIVSISLDDKHSKWIKAIEDDGLIWPYHLCDYTGWETKLARQFQIEEIPNNLLYNQEGQILAKFLEPDQLDKQLEGLFSK